MILEPFTFVFKTLWRFCGGKLCSKSNMPKLKPIVQQSISRSYVVIAYNRIVYVIFIPITAYPIGGHMGPKPIQAVGGGVHLG